jgi:Pyruvate/2-oxoacid:ferredoxin oxidoreductase delta subunit/flavodoxin
MTGIYFSGTGNTKHCVEEFVRCFDAKNQAFSIETPEIDKLLANEDIVVFGHPTHFSNAPKMVRDFILSHKELFRGKKIFIIATMGLFSGDGAGCSARIFRKCGAKIIGGLHLKMPDCIGDSKLLKKSLEENQSLVRQADRKIHLAAERLKLGKPLKEGLNIFYHIAGLFGQRLWFYGQTLSYKDKPSIDTDKCTVCGLCMKNCPMKNLEKREGKIIHQKRCTMCYRCVSNCPAQALTILGKQIYEQCLFEKYQYSE